MISTNPRKDKMRKVSKQGMKRKLDKEVSRIVRAKGTCAWCGKEFTDKPSHIKKRKYCSKECRHKKDLPFKLERVKGKYTIKRYLIKHTCESCGKEFYSKKQTQRFCSRNCIHFEGFNGEHKHALVKRSNGYYWIYKKDHPHANRQGYVYYHRIIAEKKIGRILERWEVVHHVDLNKSNNNPENLQVMSEYDHAIFHFNLRKEKWTTKKFMYTKEDHCEKVNQTVYPQQSRQATPRVYPA